MAYYLKKTKLKGRTYLSIDESFYSHEKKGTAHRCYKSLGSVETWIQKGMDDPVSHFQQEVDSLNQKNALDGVRKIPGASFRFSIYKYRQRGGKNNNCSGERQKKTAGKSPPWRGARQSRDGGSFDETKLYSRRT